MITLRLREVVPKWFYGLVCVIFMIETTLYLTNEGVFKKVPSFLFFWELFLSIWRLLNYWLGRKLV